MENKLRELGNYLLTVYDKSNEEYYYNIKGSLIDVPEFLIPQVLRSLRLEDENENKSVVELDENNVEKIVHKKSQLNEIAFIFGIDYSNTEVKNKVLEYLNELLEHIYNLLIGSSGLSFGLSSFNTISAPQHLDDFNLAKML